MLHTALLGISFIRKQSTSVVGTMTTSYSFFNQKWRMDDEVHMKREERPRRKQKKR